MISLIPNLMGLKKEEFFKHIEEGNISLKPARLIPVDRSGDEATITNVFLSALRLVKEFRKEIFQDIQLSQGSEILYFTEISFREFPNSRFDGMIVSIKGEKIIDIAVFEMKNGTTELSYDQLDKYSTLCKSLKIDKLVTVSNQFVSDITHCPVGIKSLKNFSRFHLSWTYLLTIAHVLLFKNNITIEDRDQIEIMKEVLEYLENKKSGVVGFNYMKKGWISLVEQINTGETIKPNSIEIQETLESWIQEEQDLALYLSRRLGLLVDTKNAKYKKSSQSKMEDLKKDLLSKKELSFKFRTKELSADFEIIAMFEKRVLEFNMEMEVGEGSSKGKISWLKKQFDSCFKKSSELDSVRKELYIDIFFKNSAKFERVSVNTFYLIQNEYNAREIRSFKIIKTKDYGKLFLSTGKFIESLEKDSLFFYQSVLCLMKPWMDKEKVLTNTDVQKIKVIGVETCVNEPDLNLEEHNQEELVKGLKEAEKLNKLLEEKIDFESNS